MARESGSTEKKKHAMLNFLNFIFATCLHGNKISWGGFQDMCQGWRSIATDYISCPPVALTVLTQTNYADSKQTNKLMK